MGEIDKKLVDILRDNGFYLRSKRDVIDFNGWNGVSRYHPDFVLINENKEATFSLQGVLTPLNDFYKELFDTMSVKYICLKIGDEIIYETWSGEIPDKEIINKFLK
jgi:hypothetical protein